MDRTRSVPLAVGAAALAVGWVVLRLLTGPAGTGLRPYREVVGFAVATPAGLVALTYLGSFRFDAYYSDRSAAGLAVDFGLAVAVAVVVGLVAVRLVVGLTASPVVLFVAATTLTFVAAAVTFVLRTRSFVEWERSADEG